jgi:hypothetical protein
MRLSPISWAAISFHAFILGLTPQALCFHPLSRAIAKRNSKDDRTSAKTLLEKQEPTKLATQHWMARVLQGQFHLINADVFALQADPTSSHNGSALLPCVCGACSQLFTSGGTRIWRVANEEAEAHKRLASGLGRSIWHPLSSRDPLRATFKFAAQPL